MKSYLTWIIAGALGGYFIFVPLYEAGIIRDLDSRGRVRQVSTTSKEERQEFIESGLHKPLFTAGWATGGAMLCYIYCRRRDASIGFSEEEIEKIKRDAETHTDN